MNRRDALAALVSLPAVASVAVASVKPDDVIVVECDGILTPDTVNRLKSYVDQAFPDQKVVVLGEGIHIKVMRR